MMRNKGIFIQRFSITPPILRPQLQSNGVSSFLLRALLNPNDKQDLVLGYSLLMEIWSLPAASPDSDPSFFPARKALHIYGHFSRNLIMPYICVDFNLDEQLIHLSAAAHHGLALYLYNDNSARTTKFMPTQSYVDIMLMIKNIYIFASQRPRSIILRANFTSFSLAPTVSSNFFGLIRTAVGTDMNVDTIQLGSRHLSWILH